MNERDELMAKIDNLEEKLEKLKSLQQISREDFIGDFRNIEASKSLLQSCIEIMIDMANVLIARRRLGKADTNADVFEVLAEHNMLSSQNKEKYIDMAEFRNRVVHTYDRVDEYEIYDLLQNNLGDFRGFIEEILEFIN